MKKVDDWVQAAMTDDRMVAELLLQMKHSGTAVSVSPAVNLTPLRWGFRKQRSRPSRFRSGVVASLKKDKDFVRASPTTPLSWSGGGGGSTSPSTETADGFDDISRKATCSTSKGFGSKMILKNENTSYISKRSKKKKSSSELQDEENLKLKERLDLKKKIASLRVTFDEQNLRNQRLKKIKLDLNSGRVKKETLVRKSKPCKTGELENHGSFFFLPDLNMEPSEDEIAYGTI